MKWTISSLYLMVFISLLGFGWAIDLVYNSYQGQTGDPLESQKLIFSSFKQALDEKPQLLQADQQFLPDLFQLDKPEDFPLPAELEQRLNAGDIIVLESDQGISMHQHLNHQNLILGFGPIVVGVEEPRLFEFTLTVVFYLGIALVLIIWITPLVKSVQKLSGAAKAVGNGDLGVRLNQNAIYLSELNQDFNRMVERLNTLSDNNQLFSQAVSHDLRTPLSRIKFALEKLNNEDNLQQRLEVIDKIHSDIAQIENLTGELLDYARIGQTRSTQVDEVDIDILLRQVIGEYSDRCDDIEYRINGNGDWDYMLDSNLFHKVIDNLIKNGLDYTRQKLLVELSRDKDYIQVIIEDDGPGIDAGVMGKIFAPFQMASHKSKKHFGLGLAICYRAMKLLGGSITADNHASLGGARFIVRLPI